MNIEDKLYPFLNFYNNSPQFIRYLIGSVYKSIPLSIRYGKVYAHYFKLLNKSQYWDDEKIKEYIFKHLKKTLINAYENTVFHKSLFNEIGFNPYNFSTLNEMKKIPFIDKDIIRRNKNLFINKTIPQKDLLYMTTGGTSGVPVEVYYVKGRRRPREFAFMTTQWKRIGYKIGDRIAVLRGTVVDHKGKKTFFKHDPIKNRLFLSTYDLYEENFRLYIEKLKEFKPHFIHTYPSAIMVLAKYILNNNIHFDSLKALFCSSEQFYPGQRELIEEAFKARVFSWYGHTESTTLAGECEISNNYHIFFEYGYTELIDEKGNVITEPGKQGEIVGTSFEMSGFPIIRYKTGDYAEYVNGRCKCGRNYKLITNVKGRWLQEAIITKMNSRISLTALNMHSSIFNNVIQYQFYQKEKGKVVLRIVKSNNYSDLDEKKIITDFGYKFKDIVEMNIKYVNNIKRTNRGKHKFLVQEIEH